MISPIDMVNDIFRKMSYGGNSPLSQNKFTKVLSSTLIIFLFTSWILQFLHLYTAKYEEFGFMIMDVVLIAAVWQISTKTVTVHYKRKYILRLIETIYNNTWIKDSYSLTEEEHSKSQQIYRYCIIVTRIYTVSLYCTCIGHCVTAVLRGNHNMVLNYWLPNAIQEKLQLTPYYEIFVLTQSILITLPTLTGLVQMDNFYVTIIAIFLGQLKIIKYKLLSLSEAKNKELAEVITDCVDQHNVAFEMITLIETIYSFTVLHFCASDLLLGVVILLGFLIEKNFIQLLELVFIMITVFVQLYVFCLLGQIVQDESIAIADAAYNCKWENVDDNKVKISLMRIIQRSLKPARLSMGGFLYLNLENFTRISRLMMSILTLILNTDMES